MTETEAAEDLRKRFLALREPRQLAKLLQIALPKLSYVLFKSDPEGRYRTFLLRKRRGGSRVINAPNGALRVLQKRLSVILQAVYRQKPSVHGFVAGRSILTNADRHARKRYVLNADLLGFFPSINFGRVRGLLMGKPYALPAPVATYLAQLTCHENELPQGAATSPVISNMICASMDSQLQQLAKTYRCTYTRYADDLSISTSVPVFPPELATVKPSPDGLVTIAGPELVRVIESNGFALNSAKTTLQRRHWHQEVCGLTVNQGVNVRRRLVRQIRSMLYAWEKFGYDKASKEHAEKYRAADRRREEVSFRRVVAGKVEFLRSVKGEFDPVYLRYSRRFRELDPKYRPEERDYVPQQGEKDVFISHASADKKAVVEPLMRALEAVGVSYWYDKAQIRWGGSVVDSISEGLIESRYVVVVVSLRFLDRKWTRKELSIALHEEVSEGEDRVLPLMVGSERERERILSRLPFLRDKKQLVWDGDGKRIAAEVAKLVA